MGQVTEGYRRLNGSVEILVAETRRAEQARREERRREREENQRGFSDIGLTVRDELRTMDMTLRNIERRTMSGLSGASLVYRSLQRI